jgi:hypothetical protein
MFVQFSIEITRMEQIINELAAGDKLQAGNKMRL